MITDIQHHKTLRTDMHAKTTRNSMARRRVVWHATQWHALARLSRHVVILRVTRQRTIAKTIRTNHIGQGSRRAESSVFRDFADAEFE